MLRVLPLAIGLVSTGACVVASPERSRELQEVTSRLFVEFEDEALLAAALDDLGAQMDQVDLDGSLEERSFEPAPLTATDVGELAISDRDPEDCSVIALAFASAWSPVDHAGYQVLDDLSVLGTASSYTRTFLEPEDPACFSTLDCDVLRTENTIVRENILMTLAYTQRKDYRWVSLDAGPALSARSWLPESAHGEAGNNHIWQSFEVEVWLPAPDGSTRYYAQFSEVEYAGVDDALAQSLSRSGAQSAMDAAEDYLAGAAD